MDHVQDSAQPNESVTVESTSVTTLRGSASFIRGVFSDQGEPSSSRILTFVLAIAVVVFLGGVFRHICRLTDATQLGLFLSNLPLIIGALIGLMAAPYTINKASGSVSDIIGSLKRGA